MENSFCVIYTDDEPQVGKNPPKIEINIYQLYIFSNNYIQLFLLFCWLSVTKTTALWMFLILLS